MIDHDSPAIGRFDKSFLIYMIRDFFLVLVAVTVLEFGVKAALVLYGHVVNGEAEAAAVAEDLADNVRAIMRNEGGPVAARTIYPILKGNWSDLGYQIAIEPSAATVSSIEAAFGFTPRGIPAGPWPEGRHVEARTQIEAEGHCLSCHADAELGDVLGVVTVRGYLADDFTLWLDDVQLAAGLSVGKVLLHSVLLFLILRARMEPLLRLRAVVSSLARAYGGLHHRAEIRSEDEFGALARDLNLFLDRITRVVAELDAVLAKVVQVNDDIVGIQAELRDRIETVATGVRRLERQAMVGAKREPRLSQAWFDAVRGTVADLDARIADGPQDDAAGALIDDLRAVIVHAEAQLATNDALFEALSAVGDDADRLAAPMSEMSRLEERMRTIIEAGGALVRRLRPNAPGNRQAPPGG